MQLIRINVGVPPDIHERLAVRAQREGRSVAAMAARLIEHSLRAVVSPPRIQPMSPADEAEPIRYESVE